ncbi:probable plastid-lipid-associated protein 14, chloroplastic [Zingiber officinale]|uniref:probable plastid-lipid-associated protein 14, chloroplastic n=1 Tax=Zingiber officinale TaxID=94328 RepID=UPI001C4AA76D|nr:probable plastid-lipid-associated protein 14, chloroplastic [Zingiber officinale]
MALCGVSFLPARDALRISLPPLTSSPFPCSRRSSGSRIMRRSQATCSLRKIDSAAPSGAGKPALEADEQIGPVMKFRMSDFAISSQVSVGLHGRADELIFEATVCDPNSSLYKSRVVLRQLTTVQAKRRGQRALEVLKKLARRKLMYHSYAMQVYGYVFSSDIGDNIPFTLVHGYHGSYSLRHWLQLSDWLPTLEVTLALDDECLRRVGDDTTGGPAVSRQHRLTRILMRDLLIAVNYLHSHGLAHTELRLENVHISPVDKHVKIGILGNAADFNNSNPNHSTNEVNNDRRKLMIAFDMRCVGFIMARLILKELMDASIFLKFKSFLTKGNDPSCLREFLLPILCRDSPSGNPGLQIMDRNWGAGWNLLSQLLALKPSKRISCLDALRHPFLCGPKWRTGPSMDLIRWGLGSTTVRMSEDYIYVGHQRSRIAYFIELMELLNPNPRTKGWLNFLPGRWRLLYSTGRHIGLTLRQTTPRVLIDDAYLTLRQASVPDHRSFSLVSNISFKIIPTPHWPHDKSGPTGSLQVKSLVKICPGRRHYPKEEDSEESRRFAIHNSASGHLSSRKWKGMDNLKELPSSLPAVKLTMDDIDVSLKLDSSSLSADAAKKVLQEVRTQIPFEMFDVSKFVCGTYVDSRMMVLRGISGSALLFTRSCSVNENV